MWIKMLSIEEKEKIKDILSDGLKINKNIYLPYFLDAIQNTNLKVENIQTQLNQIVYNQRILEKKLDMIINLLQSK